MTQEEERVQMSRCCQDMHKENEQLRDQLAAAEKRVKELEEQNAILARWIEKT